MKLENIKNSAKEHFPDKKTSLDSSVKNICNNARFKLSMAKAKILPLVFLLTFPIACATTSPKPNYLKGKETTSQKVLTKEEIKMLNSQDKVHYITSEMYQESPEFALEFAQISELNDGITPKEAKAVIDLWDSIKNRLESTALKDMVLAGKGDHNFSAPLQALLWGYMDGRFGEGNNPLEDYKGIEEFMNLAWGNMRGPRWADFEEVTSRLNLPELINFYEAQAFRYIPDPKKDDNAQHPKKTFERKGGDCEDFAIFASYCLKKAGYKTKVLGSFWGGSGRTKGHTVAIYEKNEKFYISGDTRYLQGRDRSFKSKIEIGTLLANERGFPPKWIFVYDWKTLHCQQKYFIRDSLI